MTTANTQNYTGVFRCVSLNAGDPGRVNVSFQQVGDVDQTVPGSYLATGNLNIMVDSDAGRSYYPGQLYDLTLTAQSE